MTDKPVVVESAEAAALNAEIPRQIAIAGHTAFREALIKSVIMAHTEFGHSPLCTEAAVSGALAGIIDGYWRMKPPGMALAEVRKMLVRSIDGYLAQYAAGEVQGGKQ